MKQFLGRYNYTQTELEMDEVVNSPFTSKSPQEVCVVCYDNVWGILFVCF